MRLASLVLCGLAFGTLASASSGDCRTLEECLAAVESTAVGQSGLTPDEQALARALQGYGRKAVPGLLAMLKSPRRGVRALAAYALRDLDGLTEADVPALRASLEAREGWIAPALGRIGSPAAIEALLADLRAHPETGTQTTYAFKKAGARAVPFLLGAFACPGDCGKDFLVALVSVFNELGAEGSGATDGLVAIATDVRRPLAVRRAALEALATIGEGAASAAPAVQKLGRTAPKDFGDLVLPVLEGIKSPAAVDAMVAKLRAAPDERTLMEVAALKGAGRGAGPTLVGLLGHREWDVRVGAARALGYVGYSEASGPLQAALRNEEDWRLVYAAAESLGRLKDTTATAPLSALAGHWFPPVREAALKAASVISGHDEYKSRWHEKNFGFEFGDLEHVGSELTCRSTPPLGDGQLTADRDLARALAAGMTYDATIVAYGPGPGGTAERHEHPVKQKPNAALELEEGWFLGGNRGEWGGELAFVDRRGRQAIVLDDNVAAIARVGQRIVAVSGLAHLFMNHGIVREIAKDAQGRWSTRPWRVLPGSPSQATSLSDGRLWIRTNAGDVALSADGRLSMIACGPASDVRPGARTQRP